MPLPVSIDNVLTRDRQLLGDLIIAARTIYFFPHTERRGRGASGSFGQSGYEWPLLLGERVASAALHIPGLQLLVLFPLIREFLRGTTNRTRLKRSGLWREGDSGTSIAARLDAELRQLAAEPVASELFSITLPKPSRFHVDDVLDIRMSWNGILSIRQRYDTEQFRIGFRRRKVLLDALWEAGFAASTALRSIRLRATDG